ncbi:MAG: ATP:cob(I)alamin adenosyltransferase [Elusimicrobia bacterium RIFCSPLOWO2_01_FULL_64_13]|nr:MAG: ATP:cob(I)alamin adenosyltransferase [Elusimicrobia bacterium RIFCSPHIGHO2_01_FULL_64_10]OGR94393.1 MAG: ATP:cob(I)alamin adenosyltransferase [Elusimicrobia bacterium RIFCSPLOWO2_01_FULL_64_13]
MTRPKRIYTRSGDAMTTGILGGFRLTKHSARIEALGSLDELNSFLGFLFALTPARLQGSKIHGTARTFAGIIERIQRDLFAMGAELSHPLIRNGTIPHPLRRHYPKDSVPRTKKLPSITHEDIHRLEETIDALQAKLPALDHFILPRGNPVGAISQVVRAISRRAERRAVQLAMHSKINPLTLAYLNRLSDLLFLLARALNLKDKEAEILWIAEDRPNH